ncbi:EF-hand domain pair [Phytophthora infestans]|uniref:EF-hand domain pair n=1 Tax=Phytophthora infestans TaxID=4787 RepID=A0A833W4L3_PHYIN|nr:EF-hand domain pair [Phytophthora infestans]KAF4137831.1 EF-hand domain pair [Phytophthora infestans]
MSSPLQRNNFRCLPDGPKSPQRTASMAAGAAVMGGTGSPGKYHTEFPARQRKRLQVGTTNLTKSVELNSLPSPAVLAVNTSDRIAETKIAAMKSTVDSPQHHSAAHRQSTDSGKITPLVLRTETRRLRALSPANSSRSTDENRDVSVANGTPKLKQLPADLSQHEKAEHPGPLGNNAHEDSLAKSSDLNSFFKMNSVDSKEKISLAQNRAKLYDVFMEKYGSVRAVFRAFDNDGNGMISAQRFHDMVEAAEVDLTPNETRALYRTADVNGDNTVAFQEFVQMFSPNVGTDMSGKSAFSPIIGQVRDPSSSMAIKYHTPLELSPRSRRRMTQLRKQVTDALHRKHGLAMGVRGGRPEQLLAYAFKNVDSDNDGLLSYSQVEHALGSGYLQLEDTIVVSEMREMLQLMDQNGDEQISLREFVRYFAAGERDVATDMIDNGRKKELAALHVKRTVDLTPREEVDPIFAHLKNAVLQKEEPPLPPDRRDSSPGACLPEQLSKRTAAIINADNNVTSPARTSKGGNSKTSLSSSHSSLQLEIDRRPATSSATGSPIVAVLTPVSCDRFYHRRRERTDWTRVGVGGNGTGTDTGMYMSSKDRFSTTSSGAYSPLYRAPPSAKNCDVNDSFLIMRDGKSTATIEEDARRARRTTRYERTQVLLQGFEEAQAQDERLKDWKTRASIRKVAGERFDYLDRLQEREHRVASREDCMLRRNGGASFLRMWAGSAESQFNNHQHASS